MGKWLVLSGGDRAGFLEEVIFLRSLKQLVGVGQADSVEAGVPGAGSQISGGASCRGRWHVGGWGMGQIMKGADSRGVCSARSPRRILPR